MHTSQAVPQNKPHILNFIWRFLTTYTGVIWSCLVILVISTIIGINEIALNLTTAKIVWLGLIALGVNGFLSQTQVSNWLLIPNIIGLGGWYLGLSWAGLWQPLWILLKALIEFGWQRFIRGDSTANLSQIEQVALDAHQIILTLITRIINWFSTIGQTGVTDPLVIQLIWGGVLWLVIGLLSWFVWRRKQPLVGFLPLGAILSTAVFFSGQGYGHLITFFACMNLLLVTTQGFNREKNWRERGIDYTDTLFTDLHLHLIPLILMINCLAFFIPKVSISQITETIYVWFNVNEAEINQFAHSFGLDPDPVGIGFAGFNGLPRNYLLGNNPELGEQLVMTVKTGELPSLPLQARETVDIPTHYWQAISYSNYTLDGWHLNEGETIVLEASVDLTEPIGPGRIVEQVVQRGTLGGNLLYTSGNPLTISQTIEATYDDHQDLIAATLPVKSYQATSWLVSNSPALLRTASTDYPADITATYLQLPDAISNRVRNLALDLTTTQPTPYDKAIAIESYLRTFPYNLDVSAPPGNQEIADYFLFDLQEGYCDYYATSMVVLARSAGLPARFVIGYASGHYDTVRAEYRVTEAEAHSWAQIYFPEIGWVNFEPTAGRPGISRLEATSGEYSPPSPPEIPPISESDKFMGGVHWFWIVALLVVSGYSLWQIDYWRLRQLTTTDLSDRLYEYLQKSAIRTGLQSDNGFTPYEFKDNFLNHLEGVLGQLPFYTWRKRHFEGINTLIETFVQNHYAPPHKRSTQARQLLKIWLPLRTRLWGGILGVYVGRGLNKIKIFNRW